MIGLAKQTEKLMGKRCQWVSRVEIDWDGKVESSKRYSYLKKVPLAEGWVVGCRQWKEGEMECSEGQYNEEGREELAPYRIFITTSVIPVVLVTGHPGRKPVGVLPGCLHVLVDGEYAPFMKAALL